MDKTIIYNNNIRNKQKYTELIELLTKYKFFKKKCKNHISHINDILTNNVISNINLDDSNINDESNILINNLIIINYQLKLYILHMVHYLNKLNSVFQSIK